MNMASGCAAESCFNFFVTDSRESGSTMGRFAGNADARMGADAAEGLIVFFAEAAMVEAGGSVRGSGTIRFIQSKEDPVSGHLCCGDFCICGEDAMAWLLDGAFGDQVCSGVTGAAEACCWEYASLCWTDIANASSLLCTFRSTSWAELQAHGQFAGAPASLLACALAPSYCRNGNRVIRRVARACNISCEKLPMGAIVIPIFSVHG